MLLVRNRPVQWNEKISSRHCLRIETFMMFSLGYRFCGEKRTFKKLPDNMLRRVRRRSTLSSDPATILIQSTTFHTTTRVDSESRFAFLFARIVCLTRIAFRKYHCDSRESHYSCKKVKMCYFVKLASLRDKENSYS
jgi:hypothetical protein